MRRLALAAVVAASVVSTGCATDPEYGYGYGPYNNGYGYGPYNNGYGYSPYYNGYNNGYYYDSQGRRIATGAAVGAVGGAVAGAVLPGISPVGGAVAGAILGGVLGATVHGRQYYRDTRGYCYYVGQYGRPRYSYDVRC
ncbi:MAG TPA: hypothetical protein VE221_01760 [Sphingomicrobium sp.]|nr:hypothetical protein [Sphingomicrobium sp.]